MLSEHSIAQSTRAQYGAIRVKVVRLLPKMYKFSARRADAAQAFMVRSSRITSTAGYSFPSLRRSISAPILPRARHTHMDWIRILDSGFGFGLDWITDAFAIHLLSFAIICCHLLSGGGNLLFFIWILRCSSHLRSRNTARPHLAEPDHVQACHGIHGSLITKMVLPNTLRILLYLFHFKSGYK